MKPVFQIVRRRAMGIERVVEMRGKAEYTIESIHNNNIPRIKINYNSLRLILMLIKHFLFL